MTQMTKEQALYFYQNKMHERITDDSERFEFQLLQDRLCMPFSEFHRCAEVALGRPVFTHEFAYPQHLKDEFYGNKPKSDFADIIALIPADKLIIVKVDDENN